MLKGKNINLRVAERKDVPLITKWWNNKEYMGEYQDVISFSETEFEKRLFESPEMSGLDTFFIIEKKDGTKIGHISSFTRGKLQGKMEIGYAVVPNERNKGYGTEAIRLMVDYLFLKKDIVRVQVTTNANNIASQRILEKSGFSREGVTRKSAHVKGEFQDEYLYSIIRRDRQTSRLNRAILS